MRILQVIEHLGRGGAARSMLAQARYAGGQHTVLSLRPPDPAAVDLARAAGVEVLAADDGESWRSRLAGADLVHVHFWNTPEMYEWMRSPLPPARLLLTCDVAGEHPAQVLTRSVVDFADFVVLATPYTLELPLFRDMGEEERCAKVDVVLDAPDLTRLDAIGPRAHAGFRVGYVGTVGFVKIHPHFVRMSARVAQAEFVVCGGGDAVRAMTRQADELKASARFHWLGYVEDVASVLAGLDVFGYPLRADSYASGEMVVQEAMYAGVPPVLFDHGAAARLVADGETGLLVRDERGYAEALESLRERPAERRRLGANAREYARAHFGAQNTAPRLAAVYERVATMPKRERHWPRQRLSPHLGADAFLEALGAADAIFRQSLRAENEDQARQAEDVIARASPVVTDPAAGGVLHYRRFYPQDPYLRLWSGLVLAAAGRPALAAAEFQQAIDFGLARKRAAEYLAEAVRRAS